MGMNKKGQAIFAQLGALATGIATLAIVLIVTFLIMAQGKEQMVAVEGVDNTTSFNATSTLQSAVGTIPGWVPLIVIAVIGSVLLGLVGLFRRS